MLDAPAPPDSARGPACLSRLSGPSWIPAIGTTIKHYELIRVLGKGGMGVVYLARDTRLGRLVALKLLFADGAESASRLLAEARATASCKHENIVIVYDVDEHEGSPYLVLEYIEGQTLRAFLDQRRDAQSTDDAAPEPLSMGVCLDLILPVVRALVCAHERGVVHRDLKPENILISENGPVKVVDFGIAQQTDPGKRSSVVDAPTDSQPSDSGTLAYMAPELWLGLPADHAVDIWALGIILFELVTGTHPLAPATPTQLAKVADLGTPMPSARALRKDIEPLAAIIDRCLAKSTQERFSSAAALHAELASLRTDTRMPLQVEVSNPFAGLLAFQEADAARFFGRERDTAGVLARLRFQPLVAVAGPSGAGKSSFVRAGVIPGFRRLGEQNLAIVLRPGTRPLLSLAAALEGAGMLGDSMGVDALASKLRVEFGFLGATLRAHCRSLGRRAKLLLFLDQFEEVHTLCKDPDERAAFLSCIEGAADDASSPLRVVVAMRSDFLDRMANDRKLMADIVRGLVFLAPMGRSELCDALTKPVDAFGYRFENEALVDEILAALGRTTSPLPLLQFTAAKLWEARDRELRLLTASSYQALGGVEGTLASHADSVLASMSAGDQPLVRTFFEHLVTPERTRAVVSAKELCELAADPADGERVLGRLVEARLLVLETETASATPTVEIIHESLIARWPMLSRWLGENEEDAVFLGRLRSAAREWRASGRSRGLLWRDEAMLEASRWRERSRSPLPPAEAEFLAAVLDLAKATARARRISISLLVASSVIVAVAMGYLALRERQASEEARERAAQTRELAERARLEAARSRDAARLASARDHADDPTTALALLREVEAPEKVHTWAPLAAKTIRSPIARAVLSGHDGMVWTAEFSPDGRRVLTVSADIASIWDIDGASPPIVLRGHTGPVWRAAYSPDGRHVLTASWDGTARVWNADGSGNPIVMKHPERVSWADFSPDGRRVATTSWDKAARIWNADGTGDPIVLHGHAERARRIRFSPDGSRVVTASYDGTARVFLADGKGEPVVLKGHESPVFAAVFSPDGKRVASASTQGRVLVHSLDDPAKPISLVGHTARVNNVAWSPDGARIVSASADGTARVFRADGSGKPIVLAAGSEVRTALFSPDGKHVLTGGTDKTARLWTVSELDTTTTLPGHDGTVEWGAFSADGEFVVTAAEDGAARVWDTHQKSAPVVFPGPKDVYPAVRFSPDGQRVVIGWDKLPNLDLFRVDGSGDPIHLPGNASTVYHVEFDAEGQRIAVATGDGTTRIFRADGSGDPIDLSGSKSPAEFVAFSPKGTKPRVAVGSRDGTIRIWNADGSGDPFLIEGSGAPLLRMRWSPDGERLLAASIDDRIVRIWSTKGSSPPTLLTGHSNIVHGADWSPDGKRVLTCAADNTARIFSADGSGEPVVLRGHTHEVRRASFSPDGSRIATVSNDGTLRVWNADGTGEPRFLGKEAEPLRQVAWSPDGKRILAASEKTLRIWNADGTGVPLILEGHSARIHEVMWSPDGTNVASSGMDGTVRIWPNVGEVPALAELVSSAWRATSYCIPIALRRDMLGASETMAQEDVASCRQRAAVAKVQAEPR